MKKRKLSPAEKALKKVEAELQKEMHRQIDIIYPASVVVWWRDYGWRQTRIMRRLVTSQHVWTECANWGTKKSMLQMLEEETGLELQLSGYDKSYHELAYLDEAAWDGKMLSLAQTIRMHQGQKQWLAPQLLACIGLSLHRDEKWGADRIARFIAQVDGIRQVLGEHPEKYKDLMLKETGISSEAIWGTIEKEEG